MQQKVEKIRTWTELTCSECGQSHTEFRINEEGYPYCPYCGEPYTLIPCGFDVINP